MPERYLRQSALAGLGLQGRAEAGRGPAGVALREIPFRGILDLRGSDDDKAFPEAVAKAVGLALPEHRLTFAEKDSTTVLRLGPDQWWIVTPERDLALEEKLRESLAGSRSSLVDIGHSQTTIEVSGPRARALLEKGCPLDLHPRVFKAGRCAQSLFAKADIALLQRSDEPDPAYELMVRCSFAEYVWLWLEDAAREYGLAVLAQ